MYNVKAFIRVFICACLLFSLSSPANEVKPNLPQDSLVFIASSSPMGKRAGMGFTIGDGSLVVTAFHLVYEKSDLGEHQTAGIVTIFSPYLGDAATAKIVAADKQLDLAVLKTSWVGHPSLELSDANSTASAGDMEIIGIPGIITNLLPDAKTGIFKVEREKLPVDYVAVRQKNPRFISLTGTGKLGEGWSGAPMLLPGSSKAAGCFTTLAGTKGKEFIESRGPTMTCVKNLLEKSDEANSLKLAPSLLDKPQDADAVFQNLIQSYSDYTAKKYESAFKNIKAVIDSRPRSVYVYALAANIVENMGNKEQTEQYYQKALDLNPNDLNLKLFYAQFLSDREPNKAVEILQEVWKSKELKPFVVFFMFNILVKQGEFQKCTEFLQEALKVEPDNSYLWFNLGYCFYNSGKINEAIEPVKKAVELLPERGPFRGLLAQILEEAGRYDEAELHFRKLLEIEPGNPVVHMWLAEFLAKHRPAAVQEALKEAKISLELPEKGGLTRQYIQAFMEKLKSGMNKESN
jgi:tetratricopeptide (TPR) repeat protein